MENKQIIIDGVDVSGCEKQGETIAGITCGNGERIRLANEIVTKHKLCKDNPNCVYKQLKRKEQECEELKEKYKWYDHYKEQALYNKDLCNEKSEQIDQLKAEKEQAKQKLILIRNFITDVQVCSSASIVCDKILQIIDEEE